MLFYYSSNALYSLSYLTFTSSSLISFFNSIFFSSTFAYIFGGSITLISSSIFYSRLNGNLSSKSDSFKSFSNVSSGFSFISPNKSSKNSSVILLIFSSKSSTDYSASSGNDSRSSNSSTYLKSSLYLLSSSISSKFSE